MNLRYKNEKQSMRYDWVEVVAFFASDLNSDLEPKNIPTFVCQVTLSIGMDR